MKKFAPSYLSFKSVLLIAGALLCSLLTKAQTDPTHKFLYIQPVADEQEKPEKAITDVETDTPVNNTPILLLRTKRWYTYMYADIGTSLLNSRIDGGLDVGYGMSLAFTGQLAYKLNSMNTDNQTFISAGLQLAAFNCTFNNTAGSITNDNLHFWYAGIPVMFQLVNTRHTSGNKNDINYYVQVGCTVGYLVSMSQSRDQDEQTIIDPAANYSKLMLQPFLSAGISYTTRRKVCLVGPYVSYGINNISNQSGVTENMYSYGIRFTELLFK